MNETSADAPIALILAMVAIVLHATLHQTLLSFAPLPILLSLLWTWSLTRPQYYLAGLAIVAELFSTLPLGILTAVVFVPLVTRRVWGLNRIDLSFTYLLIVGVTATVQTTILLAYDLIQVITATPTLITIGQSVPWFKWLTAVSFTTLMAFLMSIIRSNQPGFLQSEARTFRVIPYGRS